MIQMFFSHECTGCENKINSNNQLYRALLELQSGNVRTVNYL